jgi:hypothetical protein
VISPATLINAPTLASRDEFPMNLSGMQNYFRDFLVRWQRTSENPIQAKFAEFLYPDVG